MFKFLIADDEVLIRKGTLKKISRTQLPVTCVAEVDDGTQAIKEIQAQPIDFIITDMDMPQVDGVALLDFLHKHYPRLPVIVISGYQNFEYLQKAVQSGVVNYILKPFGRDELAESLQVIIDQLNKQRATKVESDELIFKQFCGDESQMGMSALTELLDSVHSPRLIIANTEAMNAIVQPIVFQHNIADSNFVLGIIDQTQSNQMPTNGSGAICPETLDNQNGRTCYQWCVSVLNARAYEQKGFMVSHPTPSDLPELENRRTLLFLIEAGRHKAFGQQFHDSLIRFASDTHCTLLDLKTLGLSFVDDTKGFIDKYYNPGTDYTRATVREKVQFQLFDFEETIDYLGTFLENVAESFAYEHLYASENTIQNVQQYLELHFRDAISLEFVAQLFYMNASYLSTLFKQQTGKSFIGYLSELRIEEAKRLLAHSDKTVSVIARQVGYDNPKYFFRVFNQRVHLTPNQYRLECVAAID